MFHITLYPNKQILVIEVRGPVESHLHSTFKMLIDSFDTLFKISNKSIFFSIFFLNSFIFLWKK